MLFCLDPSSYQIRKHMRRKISFSALLHKITDFLVVAVKSSYFDKANVKNLNFFRSMFSFMFMLEEIENDGEIGLN